MIQVSKMNGEKYFVNAEAIDFIESIPDTVLTMASGKKLIVLDPVEEIVEKIIEYKQKIYLNLPGKMVDMLDDIDKSGPLRKDGHGPGGETT